MFPPSTNRPHHSQSLMILGQSLPFRRTRAELNRRHLRSAVCISTRRPRCRMRSQQLIPQLILKSPMEAPEEIQASQRAGIDEPTRLPAAAELGVPVTPRVISPHVIPVAPLVELPSRPLPISKSDELPPAPQERPNELAVVTVTALPPQATTHPAEINAPPLSAAESREIPPLPGRKPTVREAKRNLQAGTGPDRKPALRTEKKPELRAERKTQPSEPPAQIPRTSATADVLAGGL